MILKQFPIIIHVLLFKFQLARNYFWLCAIGHLKAPHTHTQTCIDTLYCAKFYYRLGITILEALKTLPGLPGWHGSAQRAALHFFHLFLEFSTAAALIISLHTPSRLPVHRLGCQLTTTEVWLHFVNARGLLWSKMTPQQKTRRKLSLIFNVSIGIICVCLCHVVQTLSWHGAPALSGRGEQTHIALTEFSAVEKSI